MPIPDRAVRRRECTVGGAGTKGWPGRMAAVGRRSGNPKTASVGRGVPGRTGAVRRLSDSPPPQHDTERPQTGTVEGGMMVQSGKAGGWRHRRCGGRMCKRREGTGGGGEYRECGIWTRMEDSEHRPLPLPTHPRPREHAKTERPGFRGQIRTGGAGGVGRGCRSGGRACDGCRQTRAGGRPPRIGLPGADQDGRAEPRPGLACAPGPGTGVNPAQMGCRQA